MLKQRAEQIQIATRVTDFAVTVAAFFLAYAIRGERFHWLPEGAAYGPLEPVDTLLWILGASLALHLVTFPQLGFYESLRTRTIPRILEIVLKAALIEAAVLGALIFLLQAKDTSRAFFALFLLIQYSLIALEKIGARVLLSSIRRRGYNFRQVLIVGAGSNAARVRDALALNRDWGYVLTGVLRMPGQAPDPRLGDARLLGDSADLERVVRERAVDEVYFALDHFEPETIREQILLCEKLGIPARFSLAFVDLPSSRVSFSHLDLLPVLTFHRGLMTPVEAGVKRALDLAISVAGLALTAVVYPWIAARIRRQSPGPVIFKQMRVGENGRLFRCYKFRTMALDAEERKAGLAASNAIAGPMFKLERDPRVFPFGEFLRRTSLDELPQFFNILRGDMSVVGTRPPTPDEVAQYELHYRRRLSIRPGLTGLWQVSGRSSIRRFEDVLALDLEYIDHWSIWLDLRIIARTVWVVLGRRGAV